MKLSSFLSKFYQHHSTAYVVCQEGVFIFLEDNRGNQKSKSKNKFF